MNAYAKFLFGYSGANPEVKRPLPESLRKKVHPGTSPDDHEIREIVDDMLNDRARYLVTSRLGRHLAPLVKKLIHYENLVQIVSGWRACHSGVAMIESMHRMISPRVSADGIHNLPRHGRCLLVTNHPTGLTDGVALFDIVGQFRRDVAVFVFDDLLRINAGATDALIPVDWKSGPGKKSGMKQTLSTAARAFKDDRLVVIFPAGRLSYWNGRKLRERPWQSSFLRMATKYNLPIIPGHIDCRNSLAFYALSQISTELRDIQSMRELQNKKNARYHLTFGPPIDPGALGDNHDEVAGRLQHYVENVLPRQPDTRFDHGLHCPEEV